MRLEQLSYFVEIVRRRSINKAAETLFISQSTLSDALKKLEEEIGVKLLLRHNTGVSMTLAGEALYRAAQDVLTRMQQFKEEIAEFQQTPQNVLPEKVALTVTPEMLEQVVPQFMEAFQRQYPKTTVLCRSGDFMNGLWDMAEGKADAALIMLYDELLFNEEIQAILQRYGLQSDILKQSKAVICVSAESKLARRRKITIKEAIKQPLSVYNTNLDASWHKKCFEKYGPVRFAFVSGSYALCDKYVALNPTTVGFTSELMLRHHDLTQESGNVLIELKDDFYYDIVWLTRKDETAHYQSIRELIKIILDRDESYR